MAPVDNSYGCASGIRIINNQWVVKQMAGEKTGDTIYITEDGRVWIRYIGNVATGLELKEGL